ncbi:MAG: PAS domain-containing protein [Candidatus Scalindua sp.]|nr:PAS domain-containing protein [Candidatus Scalindua sp.]
MPKLVPVFLEQGMDKKILLMSKKKVTSNKTRVPPQKTDSSGKKKASVKSTKTGKTGVRSEVKKRAPKKGATAKKPAVGEKAVKAVLTDKKKENNNLIPVIGIGASAGGLEALEGFFVNMPPESDMAIVIVQHLAPNYKSIMGSLLKKYTRMKILDIEDGMTIEPNCVYLNPPDMDVAVINRTFQLVKPLKSHAVRLPIDYFFRSLSEERCIKAICIVLSGTGTDGTLGLKAIKGEGGMAMVQDEGQAKYNSMPRSAINTGLVDYVLPVEKMPYAIAKYLKHPFSIQVETGDGTTEQNYINSVAKILIHIRSMTGQDFSNYKQNTIRRRIERRMAIHQIDKISHYLDYIRESPSEVKTLYKDLLIGVTNFFRDHEAFDILAKEVISEIIKKKKSDTIRIWVPGCATGEEAYSIAMIFAELLEKSQKHFTIQIFGTDIDEDSIEYARAAVYPESIAADISRKRLKRFFIKEDSTYKIKKQIREMLVFATQSLIKDPPFSRLDLVSCRNVLIYMDRVLQKRIVPIFHYTLNKGGYLFLGSSETIGEFSDLFTTENSKWKIYRRLGVDVKKDQGDTFTKDSEMFKNMQEGETRKYPKVTNIYKMAEREILNEYAPPFVLINDKHEILYVNGKIHKYLRMPVGVPEFNIQKMVHEDLRYKLTVILHKLRKKRETVVSSGIKIRDNGIFLTVDVTVKPFSAGKESENLIMIIFEEKEPPEVAVKRKNISVKSRKEDPHITNLKLELKSAKEYLQATIEELETSNEELQSTNEEMQSTNEELQSTNEELETSKEEQQSTNEELETVNSELQNKVNELSRANNDLNNLLASTEIATIFLDTKLRIVRFTPSMTKLFNVLPSDLNRPISDITSKFNSETLYQDAETVLNTLIQRVSEIQTGDKIFYSVRVLPYRTVENIIDGVVITFTDVTNLRCIRRLATVVKDSNDAITVHDLDGRITAWNRAAEVMYGYSEDEALKMNIYKIVPEDKMNEYRKKLKEIESGKIIKSFLTQRKTKDKRILNVWLKITKLLDESGKLTSVATTECDISELKQMKESVV